MGKCDGAQGRENETYERVSYRHDNTTIDRGRWVIEPAGIAALRAANVSRRALLLLLLSLRALPLAQPRRKPVLGGAIGCFAS